ncbi:MAG: DNA polymerase IV (DinB-like DNA polymerase) [Halobacteriales archaeon]|jgi:DNA polymerase IV (DinB-like DNA polymerase)
MTLDEFVGEPTGEADEDDERIVCHVDMDCFYAACERLREPELDGEPVVVGMGYEPGDTVGAVATASYEAREYGVESAQAISTALERLPRRAEHPDDPDAGHYRPVDMDYYESVAADAKAVLHDVGDVVREVSIDEAYLDVTDRTDWSVADGFARHVKDRIRREVGVTASVGVAPTMSAAKVASDYDKPDGLVVVPPAELREFLAPLPVEELHGVGPVTAGELRDMGIETAGDLAAADRTTLRDRFGERGGDLHDRARGTDDRPVKPRGDPKSLSRESAFAESTTDPEAIRTRVRNLAADVADRARRKGALYRTVGVKVVTPPYEVNTRERSMSGPVDDPDLVESVALDLLEEFREEAVRKVGVRVSNLEFATVDQATLEAWEGATERRGGTGKTAKPDRTPGETTAEGSETGGTDPDDGDGEPAGPTAADQSGRTRRSPGPGQATLDDFSE